MTLKTTKDLWFPFSELTNRYSEQQIMLASPKLVDGDINPEGISTGFWQDDKGWVLNGWDMCNDEHVEIVLQDEDITHFLILEGPRSSLHYPDTPSEQRRRQHQKEELARQDGFLLEEKPNEIGSIFTPLNQDEYEKISEKDSPHSIRIPETIEDCFEISKQAVEMLSHVDPDDIEPVILTSRTPRSLLRLSESALIIELGKTYVDGEGTEVFINKTAQDEGHVGTFFKFYSSGTGLLYTEQGWCSSAGRNDMDLVREATEDEINLTK